MLLTGYDVYQAAEGYLLSFKVCLAALGLSCGMWDLIPQPGIKPQPLHRELKVLAPGPLGNSLKGILYQQVETSKSSYHVCGGGGGGKIGIIKILNYYNC